jgi:glycosyltransferase-like protein
LRGIQGAGMSAVRPLRVALLTHSTNPRGGVVHTLELADALTRLGHRVTVFAPDATGSGFFRPTLCETRCIPVAPSRPGVLAMVEQRVADYLDYFSATRDDFDIWHAQDGISGNVLATLKAQGKIAGFVRTVHHVDDFADARVYALQRRSIAAADVLLTVSAFWRDWLRNTWKRDAGVVGNGVDTARFSPIPDGSDIALRGRLGLVSNALIFLAVGGVEERKNTLRILEAFKLLSAQHPAARLVIAGGASLLDHSAYQIRFSEALADSGLPESAVIRTGPLPQALMPALYRMSTALVFPSVKEGFGLVVLEALASGTPAIVSRMAPFTEYLADSDVLWCEASQPASIADAMQAALHRDRHRRFRQLGIERAAQFDWSHVAKAHLGQYALIKETCNA